MIPDDYYRYGFLGLLSEETVVHGDMRDLLLRSGLQLAVREGLAASAHAVIAPGPVR